MLKADPMSALVPSRRPAARRGIAKLLFLFLLMLSHGQALAAVELGKIFSDHMVLQRDQEIAIWGRAAASSTISVAFNRQSFSARADGDGRWRVTIPAQKAGGPFTIRVTGDGERTIQDVYFGDVWLAGGQSNMEWKLSWEINNSDEIIATANYPLIRFFEVPNEAAPRPQAELSDGAWQPASPETAQNFSAVAYLFARQNHLEKGVAVGIIDSNWGGTPAESWISRQSLQQLPAYRERTEAVYQPDIDWQERFAINEKKGEEKNRRLNSREDALATGAYRFDFPTGDWTEQTLPADFEHLAWLRREFTLDKVPAKAVLEFGALYERAFLWINEKLVTVEDWQGRDARYEIPAAMLRKGRNLIALRVGNSWSNRPHVGRANELWLQYDDRKLDLSSGWHYSNQVEAPIPEYINYQNTPSFLYNSMIHPIRGYGLRGVIWYQGEANAGEASLYHDLFSTLIEDWRQQWRQEFPFIFVQLAAFMQPQYPQPDSSWALLRDMQSRTLSLPGTGMATAIDIGDINDIHPRNKQDVATRLWGEAKRLSFGDKALSQGPSYRAYQVKGRRIQVFFDHTGQGLHLKEDDSVKGFAVAGADGVYHPARAEIQDDAVVVWSDEVSTPAALQYAWADYPQVNLYNSANLPALPFAIDVH
ncbi:sialate O-acetylesterase [Microbulbifer sp. RZ01]|nr:sialate O-acetylesterase [Microbulbifer sp. RZ01]